MHKFSKATYIFIVLFLAGVTPLLAQHDNKAKHEQKADKHEEQAFDAGKFVVHHVSDAYDYHIVSFGNTNITIPLPVILYSKHPELHEGKSFHVFMSTKFRHEHADYKGFRISEQKDYEGKIVELNAEGQEIGRPFDLSITKTVAGILVSIILIFSVLFSVKHMMKKNKGKSPKGIQNIVEPIVLFIRDEIAKPTIGDKKYEKFMPFLLTLFFFILANDILGLIPFPPFSANVTGNITVTMVLALFTFVITTINGNKHYWKEIYNPDVPWWLKYPFPLMPIVELTGVITKPFVLMVRLFANMLAGHMIVTVFVSLIFVFAHLMGPAAGYAISPVSVGFSVFILLLDILVSFIQAYVFTLLSALYFGMATADHH